MKATLAAFVVAVLLVAAPAGASLRSKNRIDHYKYTPCPTCPRTRVNSVVLDATNRTQRKAIVRKQIKQPATAYNAGGTNLFMVWESAESFIGAHNKFARPVNWGDGVNYNDGAWNHWDEVPGSRNYDTGGGAGPPEYRFRRANFTLHSCWPIAGCVYNSHPYVQITARASRTDPFRTGHSHG